MYFSHRKVDGIIMWTFWNGSGIMAPESALFKGNDFTVSTSKNTSRM